MIMLKKIFIYLFLTAAVANAQTGVHTPSDWVQDAFFSRDGKKCLTISTAETILWDVASKKAIWVKKTAEFGVPYKSYYSFFTTADPDLNFILIRDNTSVRNLVDVNNFKVTRWNYDQCHFTYNGKIAVLIYNFEKNNANKLALFDPKTTQTEIIAEKIHDIAVYEGGKKIVLLKKKGNGSIDYDKLQYFDVETSKFIDKNTNSIDPFRNVFFSKNGNTILYGKSEIIVKKADNTELKIKTHYPNADQISSYAQRLCPNYDDPATVKMLEHKRVQDGYYLSFINTYAISNGALVDSFELTNSGAKATEDALANNITKTKNLEEEKRIFNLPENVLKRRLQKVQGDGFKNYVYNSKTKCVYYVVPDKPLYEGNLVRMDALNNDPKLIHEVYEKLENIENPVLYKYSNTKPKTCPHCNGKGSISKSSQRTVADYEYTLGKKIVETTTHTNSCGNCGGCGLVIN